MSLHPDQERLRTASERAIASAHALSRMGPPLQGSICALGVLSALCLTWGQLEPRLVLESIGLAGTFVLAGWVANRAATACGTALELFAVAAAGKADSSSLVAAPAPPAPAPKPDEPPAAKPPDVATLQARLEAARAAIDPERVFEHREALATHLEVEALLTLDRDLARWFMALIQKRLRSGLMSKEVALLATRVADAFDTTPEGASLRAALPTLRRSVGLCARCAQPYTGIADACPNCLATVSFPVYQDPIQTGPTGDSQEFQDDPA